MTEDETQQATSKLPVPDPTLLTQKAVDRAISSFSELVYARFAAMDKAADLVAAELAKVATNARDETAKVEAEARQRSAKVEAEALAARDVLHIDIDRRITSTRELFGLRLDDMDKAIVLVAGQLEKIRADIENQREHFRIDTDRSMQATRELFAEKFDAINTRFLERDTRTEQAADESRTSLAAALAAAKEAVSLQNIANAQAILKSETAVQKQLDALALLMGANQKNMDDKIGDIKERVDKSEGRLVGTDTTVAGHQLRVATDSGLRGNWLAGASILIALLSVGLVVILAAVSKNGL